MTKAKVRKGRVRKVNSELARISKVDNSGVTSEMPGFASGNSAGKAELSGPDGMSQQEIEYRMMLQEAILWVTQQLLAEHKDEILVRAKDRVETLKELRG